MEPGFYKCDELSNDAYHSGPGVSNSGLKLIGQKTPYHFWSRYLDPDRREQKSTGAQMIGTALHAAALEPDRFDEEYVVGEFEARNAKGYKAWAAEQTRHILLRKDMDNVIGMRKSLWSHPVAATLLEDAYEFEYSAYARDPITDVLCRIRMDMLTHSGWIVDLKKCQDASPAGAAKAVANYGYYHQAAFYQDVHHWLTGERPRGFVFIFVEELPPHAVGVYIVDPADEQRGRREYRRNLEIYHQCLTTDTWPGYSQRAEVIELPHWSRRAIDESLQEFDA